MIPGGRGSVRAGSCRGSPGGSPFQNRAKAFSAWSIPKLVRECDAWCRSSITLGTTSRPSVWSGCIRSTAANIGDIHDALIARGLRRPRDFPRPTSISRRDLLSLHTPEYLNSLRSPGVLARILEVPVISRLPGLLIDWRILKPMRLATGGTVLACRLALEHGMAINLGGGFHHAAAAWGGGFCVYADAPWRQASSTVKGACKK